MIKTVINKYKYLVVLSIAAIFSYGCESNTSGGYPMAQVPYMVVSTESSPLVLKTELSGRTAAYNIAEVRPQINGIIRERLFEQGDYVEKDQPLYQIDPALYKAAVASAEANLLKAKAKAQAAGLLAKRYREILGTKAVSKQDYDDAVAAHAEAQAEVSYAQASLDTARINLGYTTITAPISGEIGRSVTLGVLVTQNQSSPLSTIQQINPIYVDITQSSVQMLALRKAYDSGMLKSSGKNAAKVKLILSDGSFYSEKNDKGEMIPIEGDLLFSEVSVEQSTGSVTMRAEFPNSQGILLPGMFVRAVVEEGAREGAILIPQRTVSRDNRGRAVVHKLTKNATLEDQEGVFNVEPVLLQLDRDINGKWLVLDGINAGDKIILDGKLKLQAGRPVKGIPAASSLKVDSLPEPTKEQSSADKQ